MVKTVWMTYLNISLKLCAEHIQLLHLILMLIKNWNSKTIYCYCIHNNSGNWFGYTQEDPDFTSGSTDDKCHKIITSMIHKIEFIQSLIRDDDLYLLVLLHHFANQKLQKIKHNLLTYHHMTDLYNKMIHDC